MDIKYVWIEREDGASLCRIYTADVVIDGTLSVRPLLNMSSILLTVLQTQHSMLVKRHHLVNPIANLAKD